MPSERRLAQRGVGDLVVGRVGRLEDGRQVPQLESLVQTTAHKRLTIAHEAYAVNAVAVTLEMTP